MLEKSLGPNDGYGFQRYILAKAMADIKSVRKSPFGINFRADPELSEEALATALRLAARLFICLLDKKASGFGAVVGMRGNGNLLAGAFNKLKKMPPVTLDIDEWAERNRIVLTSPRPPDVQKVVPLAGMFTEATSGLYLEVVDYLRQRGFEVTDIAVLFAGEDGAGRTELQRRGCKVHSIFGPELLKFYGGSSGSSGSPYGTQLGLATL